MQRMTVRRAGGVFLAETAAPSAAMERLANLEDTIESLEQELQTILDKLEALRQSEKTRTVTYRQLLANKLSTQDLLDQLTRSL